MCIWRGPFSFCKVCILLWPPTINSLGARPISHPQPSLKGSASSVLDYNDTNIVIFRVEIAMYTLYLGTEIKIAPLVFNITHKKLKWNNAQKRKLKIQYYCDVDMIIVWQIQSPRFSLIWNICEIFRVFIFKIWVLDFQSNVGNSWWLWKVLCQWTHRWWVESIGMWSSAGYQQCRKRRG